MYHIAVKIASNGFDEPLQTPSASAMEGSSAAPAIHGSSASAPCVAKIRAPATAPNTTARKNPASQHARICRGKIRADENSSALVPNRVSRAPIPDHTRTSHIHDVPSSCWREVARGAAACAITNPAAMAYHHQCKPCTASFNSATSNRANALLRSRAASTANRAGTILATVARAENSPAAVVVAVAAAIPFCKPGPFASVLSAAACTVFRRALPRKREESNRSNTIAASKTSTTATPHHARRSKICDAVHGTPSQRNACTTATGLSAIVNAKESL